MIPNSSPRVAKSANHNVATITAHDTVTEVTEAGVQPDNSPVQVKSLASGYLTITDSDPDQAGFLAPRASSMLGLYGQFTFDVTSGDWTYVLNDPAANALAGGTTAHENLVITSLDGKTPQTITVVVNGTNDAPTLTAGRVSGFLVEAGNSSLGTANASITFTKADPDLGDTANWDLTGWVRESATTAHKAGTYGTAFLDTNDTSNKGVVRYVLDNSNPATNALKSGDKVVDSFAITVHDISGATKTTNADFSIYGKNDAPVLSALEQPLPYTKNAVAHFAPAELLGNATDVDSPLSSLKIAKVKSGTGGTVSLESNNQVIFRPTKDFEGDAHFTYYVTDGKANSLPMDVTVSIPAQPDTTPPDRPILRLVDDTGISHSPGFTNSSGYEVDCEPGGTLEFSTTGLDGSWEVNRPTPIDQALNIVYVRQIDDYLNVSQPSLPLLFTLDLRAPVINTYNVIANESELVLNFFEDIGLQELGNDINGFTVTRHHDENVDTIAATLMYVSAADKTVTLFFDIGALAGSIVDIEYGGIGIRDLAGNPAPAFSIFDIPII